MTTTPIEIAPSSDDIDALSRLVVAEAANIESAYVSAGLTAQQAMTLAYGSVIDSVLNRVASSASEYGTTIQDVIDKNNGSGVYQYSSLPANDATTWSDLPEASSAVQSFVSTYLDDRAVAIASVVGEATHYYNPNISDPSWASDLQDQVTIGSGTNEHIFGTLPETDAVPKVYTLEIGDTSTTYVVASVSDLSITGTLDVNTVAYSDNPNYVTVNLSTGSATDGWGNNNSLSNIQNVLGSSGDDTITGNSSANTFYASAGSDTVSGGGGSDTMDYSNFPGSTAVTASSTGISVVKSFGGTDSLTAIQHIIGTAGDDTFTGSPQDHFTGGGLYINGGGGNNHYYFNAASDSGYVMISDSDATFANVIVSNIDDSTMQAQYGVSTTGGVELFEEIFFTYNASTSSWDEFLKIDMYAAAVADGTGVQFTTIGTHTYYTQDLINWSDTHPDQITSEDLYSSVYSYSAGGGTIPAYSSSGALSAMSVSPSITQNWISYSVATETMHPFVITGFSTYNDGTSQHTTIYYDSYVKDISFASGISPGDIWISASTNGGSASLVIHDDALGYSATIPYFETGKTISGYGFYGAQLHTAIESASSAGLTGLGGGSYEGSYLNGGLQAFSFATSMSVTYHLEDLVFSSGSTIDLTGNLTFDAPSSGTHTIDGFDSRNNTFVGHGGADTFYGGSHNDTFVAGSGVESMHGGSGNNTFTFGLGFNNDTVYATANAGTNTLHFAGIDPSHIRMWTDSYGNLYLQDTTNTSHTITVNAGTTYPGTESLIGEYVQQVTFDSSYATTWNLTGGLNLTGDPTTGTYLYGTAYGDTLNGGSGADHIYGNSGNDTLIGGAGADWLYGGTGNDTYVFSSGFGNATIVENAGEGTDTIHFSGIDPSHIRMWTDSYGNLYFQDSADTSHYITVDASTTYPTTESDVGTRIESVTFDSSYGTTWDLTGGLNLTGDPTMGTYLYGTAYNDTLNGGSGADHLYGNSGNDTLIGGAGADWLYGGTGNDSYVFSSGFGNATIVENTGEGTDSIHFSGINPSNIRMWTDSYGNLYLQNSADTSHYITVDASTTYPTTESDVGTRIESVTFDSSYGTTWDLTGGLNLTGDPTTGTYLYGTSHNDTLNGGSGADHLYGNSGNDTLIGGAGADWLYGGTGNDTYVFSSGFGNATIVENAGDGTDSIHFSGIDPNHIRMWTDSYGDLYFQDSADTSHYITVNGGTTYPTTESDVGTRLESVTFDSSYGTTWDLTGGLNLTGDPTTGTYLYGTSHNDTLNGGSGADHLYGNSGNDTLIGGAGADWLYGGTGNDTYVFSSGFGNATIVENAGEGTDTIHFSGIDPSHIRMWTDSYGYLYLQDTTDPSHYITVNASTTYPTTESNVGTLVESVTFDSSYGTTWDLTGGLTLTGDSSTTTLYGTAYGDTLNGGSGNDHLYGGAGDDILYGGGGSDTLTGGTGADTFVFKDTATSASVTITDFSTSEGDKIDLVNLLTGHYDPTQDAIDDFVSVQTSGSDTLLKVDLDGTGGSYSPTTIATISGVTGLNVDDLISNGHLVVPT